jgi:hypothetical protein
MDAGPAHSSSVALLAVTVLFLSGCIKSAHPEPTGEWSSVAAGTQDAVSWKLFATDPAGGGQCLAVEVGGAPFKRDGADRNHLGKVPFCFIAPGELKPGPQHLEVAELSDCDNGELTCLFGLTSRDVEMVQVTLRMKSDPVQTKVFDVEAQAGYLFLLHDSESRVVELKASGSGKVLAWCSFEVARQRLDYGC